MESLRELNRIVQKPDYKTKGNWMARNITREVALPFTWLLLHTPVTANQVTMVSIFVMIVSAFMFSVGTSLSFFVGAILFELWYLIDHMDGQIARYRKEESVTGVFFDYISHYIPNLLVFPFIAIGLLKGSGNLMFIYLGVIIAASLCLINLAYDAMYKSLFWGVYRCKSAKIKQAQAATACDTKISLVRRIFSALHNVCEIHVIMNILLVVGFVFVFTKVSYSLVVEFLIISYALIASFVCVTRLIFFVLTRMPNKEFSKRFEC